MVRFVENEVRIMGRSSSGVKGIELDGSYVVGADVIHSGDYILIVTEKGYGKQTIIDEYRLTHRGSKGVKALNVTDKNGMMVTLKRIPTDGNYDVMIITNNGIVIKMPLTQISILRRATQGVRLIHLKDNQNVATVAIVTEEENVDNEELEEVVEKQNIVEE